MTDIGWHFQGPVPNWASGLVNARFNKVMFHKPDEVGADPFPGLKTIARTYLDDSVTNALIMRGEAGAVEWFNFQRGFIERAPWIEAWEGPNEPPVQTAEQRRMLVAFTCRWADLMHGIGRKVVGLNLSVGHPAPGEAGELGGALSKLNYVGLHEYAAPTMMQDATWLCLRHLRTVVEWQAAGYNVPPIFIGELGIDGGTAGRPGVGWQGYCSADEYVRQLRWYGAEIGKDGLVCGTAVFTAAPVGAWFTFEVTEALSRSIAALNNELHQQSVSPPPPPVVGDPAWTAIKAEFGPQTVDVRKVLVSSGSYAQRNEDSIRRIVVHHTAVAATVNWAQVARYHVDSKGWPGIGYHLGITPDGGLSYLGSIDTRRYHAGDANADSIGVCFAGNFENDMPTDAALATFARLRAVLDAYLGRALVVVGHRDVGQTACPGRNLYMAWVEPLPEDEPLLPTELLAEKVRYWVEEYTRQLEAGNDERAEAILYSLIAHDDGLLYRLENVLKSGAARYELSLAESLGLTEASGAAPILSSAQLRV